MLVLGIDTSTKIGGLGLYDTEKGLIAENTMVLKQTHSERLMPILENMLEMVGKTIHDIDGYAVAIGPGSFTGLRIGVTTARTLAQITGKPIIGISTLKGTAFNLIMTDGLICPIFDARNRRVYNALFRGGKKELERIEEDNGCKIDELLNRLESKNESIFFVGDVVEQYKEEIQEVLGDKAKFPPHSLQITKGGAIAQLGAIGLERGEDVELYSLAPNYLKPAQAELNWRKKHGK